MTDQPTIPTPAGGLPVASQPGSGGTGATVAPGSGGDSDPTLPPIVAAEPGRGTSEYFLTKVGAGLVAVANGALGVASAFGAHITGPQLAAIGGLEGSLVGLVGLYTLSRGIRKRGTPG